MDDRFYTAWFPGEVVVCGRKLKTFTPYHYLLLNAINSPFVDPDGVIKPADLLAAIAACRSTYGKTPRLKPCLRDVIWRICMDRNKRLFKQETLKFSRWIGSQSSGPKFWEIISGGPKTRDLTGPDVLTLIVPVIMKTTITESEAWNMSLGRLKWISAEVQEIDGSDRRFLYEQDLKEESEDA